MLALDQIKLRIEYWDLPDWKAYREGFSITTLRIDNNSINHVIHKLEAAGLPFEGLSSEDYGSKEIELYDPEGFRIIFAEVT